MERPTIHGTIANESKGSRTRQGTTMVGIKKEANVLFLEDQG
jgi:hypothetical protein